MSLDLGPDELESEVLRLISCFEESVKKWGQPSQEELHHAVVKMASAGLTWPAAGLAAKFGTTREVLHAFLSNTDTNENNKEDLSGGMSRAAFVYVAVSSARSVGVSLTLKSKTRTRNDRTGT